MISERLNVVMAMYEGADLENRKALELVDEIKRNEDGNISFSVIALLNYVNCRMFSGRLFQLYVVGENSEGGKIARPLVDFRMDISGEIDRVSQVKHVDMVGFEIDIPSAGMWSLELYMCDELDLPEERGGYFDIRGIGKLVSSYFFVVK